MDFTRHEDEIRDVIFYKLEVLISGQVGDVLQLTRYQVVDNDDLVILFEQAITEMRTDEPCSACD